MKQRTQIRLEPEIALRLQRVAEQHGYSLAAIIRVCVDAYLPELEKKLQVKAATAVTSNQ